MTVPELLTDDDVLAGEVLVEDEDAPLLGFHWEFSRAESERFGKAILSAIASDDQGGS
ncbi:hypothetical protein GCM10009609_21880 [Pseudonocardia aurantiaca]|uniref:Uncharacterized protein n=1 Tax=Pseudonocardia aurantiaca TaxID=75290 RepID=A0ABW4FG81_9PSEU